MIRSVIILLIIHWGTKICAQGIPEINFDQVYQVPDSAILFGVDEFVQLVIDHHPVVKQANLQTDIADNRLKRSRGHFDPKLEADWDVKNFEDKSYYDVLNAGLKIPLWFPVDLKAGIDRNRGQFLNPENSIPDANGNRQMFLGLSLPVGKGLFIDERRASVKQAIVFQSMARAEQLKLINKIVYQATKDYYDWYNSYYQLQFLGQSIAIANQIFERVKTDYQFGEAAAIDTIQAKITLQNRQIELMQAQIDYTNSSLKLSNHLWTIDEKPLELSNNTVPPRLIDTPEALPSSVYFQLLEMAQNNHPDIRKLNAKIEQLQVEQRLNRENLKPQIDLSYAFLDEPLNSSGESSAFQLTDDYKFGLQFSFPIFLRKERGKIRETDLKIKSSQYEVAYNSRSIENEVNAVFQELTQLGNMSSGLSAVVTNYQRMVQAELINIQNGESDFFKLNFQQEKLINAQLKYLKLRTYYEKIKAELYYTSGTTIGQFTGP